MYQFIGSSFYRVDIHIHVEDLMVDGPDPNLRADADP